jgi:hypothetical protein
MRQKPVISRDWNNLWSARDYLRQYYRTPTIPSDEKAIFNFIIPYLRMLDAPVSRGLDFGSGPTLHHAIALTPFVEELHLADYVAGNFVEIRKWLDSGEDAHNWDIYVSGILELEGNERADHELIGTRKADLRRKITALHPGDIRQSNPLGFETTYPLVASFYAADSIAATKADWQVYMGNLASLVEPGGILIISALRHAEYYQVGDYFFPSANLNERDVYETLRDLGFDTSSEDVIVAPVEEWDDEGFDSIIVARGRKRR